jgi:curved DNA-binding protein CbpA
MDPLQKTSTLVRHYRTLNVSPDAGPAEIKSAYRKLVQQWHPDRHRHDPHLLKLAEETLKEANLAYREISAALSARQGATAPANPRRFSKQPFPAHPFGAGPMVSAAVRAGKKILDALCAATLGSRRHGGASSGKPSGGSKPRQYPPTTGRSASANRPLATFGTVLREVARRNGLRFSSDPADLPQTPPRTGRRQYKPSETAGREGRSDAGPIEPIAGIDPVTPVRRKS